MSDYGSRGHGRGPEEYGWGGGEGRSRGFGDSYDDYSDYGSRQPDSGYGADSYSIRSSSPHDEPATTGRARVSGAETGPGRARGSARVGGSRRRGAGASGDESEESKKAKKKKKRRRKLIALTCVMVMFLGIGTVVGTLFFESVPLPEEIEAELHRNTKINYSNGDLMGKIGTEFGNRAYVNVPEDGKVKEDMDVPKSVEHALLSMEDRKFYDHSGVDFWGVMRALVNNVTGGERQGASTLTQQYVGSVMEIRGNTSYLRKAEEAVMAMKMDDKYTKPQIIEHYMNLVYMGRGAYGLGAAAKAWFGVDKVKNLTASQAAVIFAQVKNPDSNYDPRNGKEAVKKAEGRWKYALKGMVSKGWMKKSTAAKVLKKGMPETAPVDSMPSSSGQGDPTGFVAHGQVLKEAKERYGLTEKNVRTQGLTITTTIDKKLQKIAEKVASAKDGSVMKDQQKQLRAALVAVSPKDGSVVAYYGGSDSGTDDDKAQALHPPGSSFKEITLAAALKDGYGPESMWNGESPRDFPEQEREVSNAGEGEASKPRISLKDAVRQSLNTPMYALATKLGANTIVKLARDMGVEKMQVPKGKDGAPEVYDLNGAEAKKMLDSSNDREFADYEVAYGQYPVPVVDMAAVNATLAAEGVHNETHYIEKITRPEGDEVEPTKPLVEDEEPLKADKANDATEVLSDIRPKSMSTNTFSNGQTFAAKSGTWERDCETDCDENASISFSGYVPELAAAAWVGDKDNENGKVETRDNAPAYGAGISGDVWSQFMDQALKIKPYDSKTPFNKGSGNGTKPGELSAGGGDDDDEDGGGEDGEDGGGDTPTCEPNDPTCQTGEPTCTPGEPGCEVDPTCGQPGQPPCDDNTTCEMLCPNDDEEAADRGRPSGYDGVKQTTDSPQYAIREEHALM